MIKRIDLGNGGEVQAFKINADESIVGIFGETYANDLSKMIKTFGLVVRKN